MAQVSANGLSIAYESFGRAEDPAILLIMGFSVPGLMWPDSLCTGLAQKGFRVIRYDNRDIGRSSKLDSLGSVNAGEFVMKAMGGETLPPAPYTLDDMARDAVGLLGALDIPSAHIVGASMGGMIAQIIAAKHGARARSLVSIMSQTGRQGLSPAKPEAMAALLTPPADTSREGRIAHAMMMWRTIGSPGYAATAEELRGLAERLVDYSPYHPEGIARQLAAILSSPARDAMLGEVRCPALVLHGVDDPLIPLDHGENTAKAIPGAKFVAVPGMAHDFTEALSSVYLREIGGFAASVEEKRKVH
ncbi:MAG: alpha/beta fold hydrolase [Alphaproteobacteria bacterium]|nr:alpha/beta fold hydrolase [Alphaproteobacteria bacterium]